MQRDSWYNSKNISNNPKYPDNAYGNRNINFDLNSNKFNNNNNNAVHENYNDINEYKKKQLRMSAPHIKNKNNKYINNNQNTNNFNAKTNIKKKNYHYNKGTNNQKLNLNTNVNQYGINQNLLNNKSPWEVSDQNNVSNNTQSAYHNDNISYEQNYLNQNNSKITEKNKWKEYEKYFNNNQNVENNFNTYIPNNNYNQSRTHINTNKQNLNILYKEANSTNQNKKVLTNTYNNYGYELINSNSDKKDEKNNEYTSSSTDNYFTKDNTTNIDTNIPIDINQNNNLFKTIPKDCYSLTKNNYYFHKTGLYNIGSTCYMNATLQFLLHVSPLVEYFLFIYPKQYEDINKINESIETKGKISNAFFKIIKSIDANGKKSNSINSKYSNDYYYLYETNSSYNTNAVSPDIFQRTVGTYNPLFRNLEANDSKDLILYLLQIMHQELNYYTLNKYFTGYPNQCDRENTLQVFIASYDATNKSIISDLFYGTNENITKCLGCNRVIYNFQKFEFISFGMFKYNNKNFNIYNGFEDYSSIDKLHGDNKYYCNNCKGLKDAEICTKIFKPPKFLVINLDYGKNKKYMPSSINYDEEIDITRFIKNPESTIRYRILCVCSHYGDSGSSGHYIAYCKNLKESRWYKFNDSMVSPCSKEEIKYGTPYLLLYERI